MPPAAPQPLDPDDVLAAPGLSESQQAAGLSCSSIAGQTPVSPLPEAAGEHDAQGHYRRGEALLRRGDVLAALPELRQAASVLGDRPQAGEAELFRDVQCALGGALQRNGDPLAACEAYTAAAEAADLCPAPITAADSPRAGVLLLPPSAVALRGRAGAALGDSGDHAGAERQLRDALRDAEDPSGSSSAGDLQYCRYLLGRELFKQGNCSDALYFLRQALRGRTCLFGRRHLSVAEVHAQIAEVLRAQGRVTAAWEHIEQVLRATRGALQKSRKEAYAEQELYCAAIVLRGQCLQDMQDDEGAAASYRRAAALRGSGHPQARQMKRAAAELSSSQRSHNSPRKAVLEGRVVGFPSPRFAADGASPGALSATASTQRCRSPALSAVEPSLGHTGDGDSGGSSSPPPPAAHRRFTLLGEDWVDPVREYLESPEFAAGLPPAHPDVLRERRRAQLLEQEQPRAATEELTPQQGPAPGPAGADPTPALPRIRPASAGPTRGSRSSARLAPGELAERRPQTARPACCPVCGIDVSSVLPRGWAPRGSAVASGDCCGSGARGRSSSPACAAYMSV
eukprot:TRINITY_DN18590_c0_g1_i1.p1 TRINITY_DN18590_c0_g1~~TRINITY_DN18590_c0_g1_i1.p1  ORF type:complete len:570 (+),score=154.79 TRINITY_DN18590_c0_g1_i1:91-1800(+)